jgi:putative endonuclease
VNALSPRPSIRFARILFAKKKMDARVKPAHDRGGGRHCGTHANNGSSSMSFWVYILASRRGGTLYIGVTNDLIRRTYEHREGLVPGFTKRYGIKKLVYYEQHDTAAAAIQREKNMKHWPREWKIDLIVSMNPEWRDLYDEITR